MKKILIFSLLSFFPFSYAQKHKSHMKEEEITFSTEKFIFYFDHTHGTKNRNFTILKKQKQLNQALNERKLFITEDLQTSGIYLKFPKNQKVILYNFGEIRSGIYRVKGIDKIKLAKDNLEVYLIKEKNIEQNSKLQVQVITYPKMIFSIPKKINFKNIIIK